MPQYHLIQQHKHSPKSMVTNRHLTVITAFLRISNYQNGDSIFFLWKTLQCNIYVQVQDFFTRDIFYTVYTILLMLLLLILVL